VSGVGGGGEKEGGGFSLRTEIAVFPKFKGHLIWEYSNIMRNSIHLTVLTPQIKISIREISPHFDTWN